MPPPQKRVTVWLTREEVDLLVPVLEGIVGHNPRTTLLANRVAARIVEELKADPEAGRQDMESRRRLIAVAGHECPNHLRTLRLDELTAGQLEEVLYCPQPECTYVVRRVSGVLST